MLSSLWFELMSLGWMSSGTISSHDGEENRAHINFYYLCEILLTLRSRVWPCGLGTWGLASCGLGSACCGLLEFLLFSEYSEDENPVFELVDVIVFVERSTIGAFVFVRLPPFAEPVAAVADVDVGEGELDDALYGKGAGKRLTVKLQCSMEWLKKLSKQLKSKRTCGIVRLINRSRIDRSIICLVRFCLHDRRLLLLLLLRVLF